MSKKKRKKEDPYTDGNIALDGSAGSLQERAMIVDLTIHRWWAVVTDRKLTQETADRHDMEVSMGSFMKRLVAKEAFEEIGSACSQLETVHRTWTLPWNDSGYRILPSAAYWEYVKRINEAKEKFNAAVESFLERYTEHLALAKKKLGTAAVDSEWPTPAKLRSLFGVDIVFAPIPASGDFRVKLGASAMEAIEADYASKLRTQYDVATKDVWQRLHTVVAHMTRQLGSFTVEDGKGDARRFRDSVVGNVEKLLDMLPALNFTEDPKLTAMAEEIRLALVKVPATIRENEDIRQKTLEEAQEIAKRLADFI